MCRRFARIPSVYYVRPSRRRRTERRRCRRPGCPVLPWRAPPSLAAAGPGHNLTGCGQAKGFESQVAKVEVEAGAGEEAVAVRLGWELE